LLSKKQEYLNVATGGAQANISQNIIRDTDVYVPPIDIQQLFASKIEAIEMQKELIKKTLILMKSYTREVMVLFQIGLHISLVLNGYMIRKNKEKAKILNWLNIAHL
jgi:restriction endonuclease S subunit